MNVQTTHVRMEERVPTAQEATRASVQMDGQEKTAIKVWHDLGVIRSVKTSS